MTEPWNFVNNGKQFYIQSALAPVYLHVLGGVAQNDAKLTTWTYVDQANLRWTLHSTNDGFYLATAVNPHFVLHQHGANNDNGGTCTLWDRTTHGNQGNLKVNFRRTEDGFWLIVFVHSGKCAHVQGAGIENGTPITQWEYVNQKNLKWAFIPA